VPNKAVSFDDENEPDEDTAAGGDNCNMSEN
jgi:hypothetical protein